MGIVDVLSSQFSVSGLASYAYVHLQPPLTIVYGNYFEVILRIRDANHVPVLTDSVSAAVYISNPSTCLPDTHYKPASLSTQALTGFQPVVVKLKDR